MLWQVSSSGRSFWPEKERGQATLPDHELVTIEHWSIGWKALKVNQVTGKIYQVGKGGLPPLFAFLLARKRDAVSFPKHHLLNFIGSNEY
jgi:hypothetical protein